MYIPISEDKKDWSNYTLIVPAVSVGNVGQLTADLLIASLWMSKVGYFYDNSFLPIIGNDPFAHADTAKCCRVMTGMEVFESMDHKVCIVQQRSPFIKGRQKQFVGKLMEWIKECGFSEIIVLTSSFSHERQDSQLIGDQFRYLATPQMTEKDVEILEKNLQWKCLEHRDVTAGSLASKEDQEAEIFLPGSGIAKQIYERCVEEKLLGTVLLLFCSEGDNSPDAVHLASRLNSWKNWLNLKDTGDSSKENLNHGWKFPSSWRLMFGNKPDDILY